MFEGKDLVAKAKAKFCYQGIKDYEGDQRKLCTIVDGLLGGKKTKMLPIASIDCGPDLVDTFNAYLNTKITKIRNDLELKPTVEELSFKNLESLHRP